MSRKPNEFIPATEPVSQAHVVADSMTLNAVSLMDAQQSATVRAVAAQIGYQLPADCTDPDLIQRDISANLRRSVEACLELGRGLAVLKAACGHGNFMARLNVLGFEVDLAGRLIRAAFKFSNSRSNTNLIGAIGNQTKLLEMIVLDDEQIEELELTGQTGDLHLDKIATMSVKELRAALREANQNLTVKERQIADKNTKLDELDAKLGGKIDLKEKWDLRSHELALSVGVYKTEVIKQITALDVIREKTMQIEVSPEEEAALERAREHIGRELGAALLAIEEITGALRRSFDCTLGALIGE